MSIWKGLSEVLVSRAMSRRSVAELISRQRRFLISLWALRFDCLPKLRGSRISTKFRSRKERSMSVAPLMSQTNLAWKDRGRHSKTSPSPSLSRVLRLPTRQTIDSTCGTRLSRGANDAKGDSRHDLCYSKRQKTRALKKTRSKRHSSKRVVPNRLWANGGYHVKHRRTSRTGCQQTKYPWIR